MWAEPGLRGQLRGWRPMVCVPGERLTSAEENRLVLVGEPLPVEGGLPPHLHGVLTHSAVLNLRLRGRPPALLWLGFRAPPDEERLRAVAELIRTMGDRLPSRQQIFLDEAPLVFISVDRKGIISDCNDAARRTGYAPEELLGQNAAILYPPGGEERVLSLIPADGLGHSEVNFRHSGGQIIPVDLLIGFIRDDDGEPLETVGVGRDLRPERRLEHHRRLEAVGRLVAGVAQELNNPLLAVVGNAELLVTTKLSKNARRLAERVLAGARRCQDVVDGLLRLRIKRKELPSVVRLHDLLHGVIRDAVSEGRGPQPQLELPEEPMSVRGDTKDLAHAVGHLITNALQAVEDLEQPSVKLRLFREADMARIAVEDNGPGMPAEVLGSAFEPFFTTREAGKGRGLGLSIAMGVVEDHGGYIELRSDTSGTVATISLPLLIT